MRSMNHSNKHFRNSRRGAALILAVAMMFVLFSFLAFSIDVGYLAQSRAELTRTADAAAMAGCWELYEQMDAGVEPAASHPQVRQQAADFALQNAVCRTAPYVDASPLTQDISIGYLASLRGSTITNDSSLPFFAVGVRVEKTPNKNGEVPYFFGRIFGDSGQSMQTESTAVLARQITGFNTPPTHGSSPVNVLPFALDEETWNALLEGNTADNYQYDPTDGSVSSGSDGVLEVNLYPQGTGSPGNRGTVDIGGSNNSTNDIARQIVDGISRQDILDLGKPLDLSELGQMTLNGDTGISAGVKDELASIIGQKRIIPVFSSVSGNGNNANYTIVKWVGVRILHVKLTGKMSGKQLIVQPAPVVCSGGNYATEGSNWSDFVLSPVMLAR